MEVLIALLAAVSLAIVVWYLRATPARMLWLLPTTYLCLFGAVHYPVRAILLTFGDSAHNRFDLTTSEIASSLAFYTMFSAVLLLTTAAALPKSRGIVKNGTTTDMGRSSAWGLSLLFALIVTSAVYRISTGRIYSLYEGLSDLEAGSVDNVMGLIPALRWLFLPWALMSLRNRRSKLVLAQMLIVVALIVADAVITTGKGMLVNVGIVSLAMTSYFGTKPRKVVVAGLAAMGIAFGVYSYLARTYGNVRGEFSVAEFLGTVEEVKENLDQSRDVGIGGIVERFSYLDGLALLLRQDVGDPGPYAGGSLIEVAMLLPRSVWPSRPHYSFNHYVTSSVWGFNSFSETPIGRVGEAFFVLGWFGLVYALIYGLGFAALVRALLRARSGQFVHAVYVFLLVVVAVPDAYLTYGWKTVVYVSPAIVAAALAGKLEERVME